MNRGNFSVHLANPCAAHPQWIVRDKARGYEGRGRSINAAFANVMSDFQRTKRGLL